MSQVAQAPPVKEKFSLICGLIAVLLWSTVATGFKLGLQFMSVLQLLWVGTTISWAIFLAYAFYTKQLKPSFGLIQQSMVLGLINPVIYYIVLFAAYDRLPAHIAQPLNYTWAITLAFLAIPVLGQKLSRNMILGIGVSYAGVVLLLTSAEHDGVAALSWMGVGLALLSTLLWATYWLLNTRWHQPPAALMFWSFSWALVILTGMVSWLDSFPEFTSTTLIYGGWVGAIEMGITFILWQTALRHTQHVGRLGQLIFLSPFISLVIIAHVLGEEIDILVIPALVAIVAGIALGSRNPA
ncbi:MAG: DMT family transporter [Pseudomonadota bacterium]